MNFVPTLVQLYNLTVTRDRALQIPVDNRQKLDEFAIQSLAIFGSVARNQATDASDIDVLVEFKKDAHIGLFQFVRIQRFFSSILGCPVDLVTPEALGQEIRQNVLREAAN